MCTETTHLIQVLSDLVLGKVCQRQVKPFTANGGVQVLKLIIDWTDTMPTDHASIHSWTCGRWKKNSMHSLQTVETSHLFNFQLPPLPTDGSTQWYLLINRSHFQNENKNKTQAHQTFLMLLTVSCCYSGTTSLVRNDIYCCIIQKCDLFVTQVWSDFIH